MDFIPAPERDPKKAGIKLEIPQMVGPPSINKLHLLKHSTLKKLESPAPEKVEIK